MAPRFNWPLTYEQTRTILRCAYQAEVELRSMSYQPGDEDALDKIADCLVNHPKKGIMLMGLCGNGKTTAIKAVQNTIAYLCKHGHMAKQSLLILTAREIAKHMNDNDKCAIKDEMLLGIDDMGTEPVDTMVYGNIKTPVVELLEHRYNKQLFTVVTTNLTDKEIKERYGLRIADRCRELFNVIIFKHGTHRI